MDIRTAAIPTTTMTSISVNPRLRCGLHVVLSERLAKIGSLSVMAHRGYRLILDVILNIAESTLKSRNPTPNAMTMIIAGSINVVMIRS